MEALPPEGVINGSGQPGLPATALPARRDALGNTERRASILVVRTTVAVWDETSLYLADIRSLLVPFPHHKTWRVIRTRRFGNPLIGPGSEVQTHKHSANDRGSFSLSAPQTEGLPAEDH